MPSTKPAATPRWATNALTTTAPTSGKQDTGWVAGEQPSAEVMNWLQNQDYLWMVYLNDFEAHALTWTALQTFSLGIVVTGNAPISGNATVGGTLGVTGNTTVGGTLGVTGDVTNSGKTKSVGDVVVDSGAGNARTLTKSLRFGSTSSGEGVSSNRSGSGSNQNGLDFWTNSLVRMTIDNSGNTAMGDLSANSISVITGPTQNALTPNGGVTNHPSGQPLVYWKDPGGMVWVMGYVDISGSPTASTLAQLPSGYRPAYGFRVPGCHLVVSGPAEVAGYVTVDTSGNITVSQYVAGPTLVSADFRVGFRT
jgi:hypothetical protein